MLRLDLFLLRSGTEDASPNTNDVAAGSKCCFEIARHAHAQEQPVVLVAPLRRFSREARACERTLEDIAGRNETGEVLVLLFRAQRFRERADGHEALQTEAGTLREDVLGHLDELRAVDLGFRHARSQGGHSRLLILIGSVDLE